MEQKKILWVILSVSLFVLVIFGIALFLYSPARNSTTAQAGGETIPYEDNGYTNTAVDPDMWARDPEKIAGLDKNAPPATGNIINLNIISTDGQGSLTKDIDVSGLTAQVKEPEISGLPKELAEQIGIDTGAEKGAETPAPQPAAAVQEKKPTVQPQPKKITEKKSVQPAAAKPKTKPAAKPAAPKVQTMYWVQTASLASRINAERARDKLAAQHMKVEIFTKQTASGLTHRVRVGPFNNNTEAKYWLKNIQKIEGFETSYITEEKIKNN
ncbi:MAG: SPOR domain-containing protein [Treponema sp.]